MLVATANAMPAGGVLPSASPPMPTASASPTSVTTIATQTAGGWRSFQTRREKSAVVIEAE